MHCENYSKKICQRLWEIIQERKVKVIHSYLPMGKEVNVLPLLKIALANKLTIASPKVLKKRTLQHLILEDLNNLEEGLWGTYHPASGLEYKGNYDLIIVPGLAFNREGFRLGYGGGFYDTFLAKHPDTLKVGVCYPFQVLKEIPLEKHDIKLDNIFF